MPKNMEENIINMKKIITIIFLLITLLLFITHYTNAVENQSIELILKSEKEEYKIGEEISLGKRRCSK